MLKPGDVVDLQYKLASSLPAEFVTRDKQRCLDMMFTIYSAKISQDNALMKTVRAELESMGKNKTGYSGIQEMFQAIKGDTKL